MARLFLSHSSANNAEAVALCDWLKAEGWDDVFLDLDPERGIEAGERWERALNEAASRCEAVLFLVTRAWLNSSWCLKEFNLARRLNKRLFGVLVEPIAIAELPGELTGTWQIVDLASGHDHAMFRVTLPVTQQEAHVSFSQEGLTRLRNGLAKAGLDARFFTWPPEQDPGRAPYRGLKPMEAEDAGIFFGRDAPIVEALDSLRGLKERAAPRLLVILGASGSGKSSFMRAGLLPRLARDDRNFLTLPVIRPERAAISGETGLLRALETALASHGLNQSRAKIREAIADGAGSLRLLLKQLVDKVFATMLADESEAKPPLIVLAIDQAEELFLSDGAEEGEALLAVIRDLVKEDGPGVIALFAIRSDSYDRLETVKALEAMRQRTLPLLPMPRGAYQTVIEAPAARLKEAKRKLTIEPRLTQRLLDDIEQGGGSDPLPLLAFTLEQLYLEHGGDGVLSLADYEAFGGIKGAIEAAVARAFKAADDDPTIPRDREARLALLRRGLIPWLAGIDPDTGSPRRRIARGADIPPEASPLIRLLVEQRLLATDRVKVNKDGEQERYELTIEPAHEALLRQWGLLQGWLQEDFAALTTLEGVKRAARDWAANGRAADWLNHAGNRLEEAEKIAGRQDLAGDVTGDANDYLVACRVQEDKGVRARRLRHRLTAAAAMLFALLTALAGWQWWLAGVQRDRAEKETTRAERNFGAAKDTVNSLIFNIVMGLRDVEGIGMGTIEKVLERARETVDQLGEAAPDDEDLLRSRAVMLDEFAKTYLAAGNFTAAAKSAEECLSIMRRLAESDKNNTDWQRGMSIGLQRVGDVKLAQNEGAAALAAYEESLAIRRRLTEADKGNTLWQRDVAVALAKVGDARLQQGETAAGLAAYEQSIVIDRELDLADTTHTQACSGLAWSLLVIGDVKLGQKDSAGALAAYEESLAICRHLAETDKGNTDWKQRIAWGLMRMGDVKLAQSDSAAALTAYENALAIVRRLAGTDEGNVEWQRNLSVSLNGIGDVRVQQGDTAAAFAAYEEALAITRRLVEADESNAKWHQDLSVSLNKLAAAKLASGDGAGALTDYNDAIALISDEPDLYNDRGDLYVKLNDLDKALSDFDKAISLNKNYALGHSNRAWVLASKDRDEEAIAEYTEALRITPHSADDLNGRGFSLNKIKQYDKAIADFDEAIRIKPDHVNALHNRGLAYWYKGDLDRAIADLDVVLRLVPDDADALTDHGSVLRDKREYDLAIADYDKVLATNPGNAFALHQRGLIYSLKGDAEKAIVDLGAALNIAPDDIDTLIDHGGLLDDKGDHDGAIADYDKVLVAQPDNANALNGRAWAYAQKGELDKALPDADRAVTLNPTEPNTLDTRGWIYIAKGDPDLALADLDKALNIDPEFAGVYADRGRAYELKGRHDKAIADYRKALSLKSRGPYDDKAKAEALQHLTALGAVNDGGGGGENVVPPPKPQMPAKF